MMYEIQKTVNPDKTRKPRQVDDGTKPNRARHVTKRKGKKGPHVGIVQAVYGNKNGK
jgi:hypothetical protein